MKNLHATFKNTKGILLGLLLCLVCSGTGWADCVTNSANVVWDGSAKEEPCLVNGYYEINTAAKLAWYAAKGSDNKWNWSRNNAKLTADIDLGGKLWIPIAPGQGNNRYSGTFDGNNHVIKNMYINGSELAQIDKNYAQNLGFIGTLGNTDATKPGGTVKNLILEDINIQASTNAGDILGRDDSQISVGSFVGWMGDKSASNVVDNCVASGTIRTTGNGQGVGGIVGNAKIGTISNCLSLVEIHTSGSQAFIGGIIGITKTDVSVSSCVYAGPGLVNTGTDGLVGGVVGNVYSGTIATDDNYFEGVNSAGVGGSNCTKNCTPTVTTSNLIAAANSNAQKVDVTNAENVACALNGTNTDGSCKEEPWSLGQTGLSLNGYGKDGYKITFVANEGAFADGSIAKNKFLAKGLAITADEIGNPSRDYYSFVGWAFTQNATESDDLGFVSQRDTVFAVWEKKIKVSFDANGGTFPDEADVKDVYITKGDPITVDGLGSLPVTYCEEYSVSNPSQCLSTMYFTGWKDDAEATVDFNNHDVFATEDVTYKAIWTDVKTYSVTFHANNNTTVDIVVYVDEGTTTSKPADPTMDGYDFVGWFDGDEIFDFGSEIEMSKDLYAHWTPKQYGVTYVLGEGGSDKGDNPVSFTLGDGLLDLKTPTVRDGYAFDGWFYDSGFKQKATSIDRNVVGDKTFYAKFSKIQYRIMYLADNNSQGAVTDQYKEHGTPITLESAGHFNRKGYAELGWATVANGEKVYEFGARYEENATLTLYPVWSDPIVYSITYVCEGCVNDTQNPETYTVLTNTGIKYASSVPEGYKFGGWFSDKKYTKKVTQIEAGTVGNLTLYGKLNINYHITYVLNGSADDRNKDDYTVDDNTFTLNPPAPVDGFIFGGWFDNADFEGDAVTQIVKGSTGDITLYAKWNKVYPFVRHYGAITITEEDAQNAIAEIDDNSGIAVNIPAADNVVVNQVTYNRDFSSGATSTVMFPFTVSLNDVSGGEFWEFQTVEYSSETGKWTFRVCAPIDDELKANKPYVFIPNQDNITFSLSGPVSLSTEEMNPSISSNKWVFKGTYENVTIDENHPDWTYGYGYAAENKGGLTKGKFFRFKTSQFTEVSLLPMRAYLVYDKSLVLTKSVSSSHSDFGELPDIVDVEIMGEKGLVVGGGSLNTITGELKMDRWYDLTGRRLNGKPTTQGTYYYNGKRVIVR